MKWHAIQVSYQSYRYFLLFVPFTLVLYQLCPRKLRPYVLLVMSYGFFLLWSGPFIVYEMLAVLVTWLLSRFVRQHKAVFVLGILFDLGVLFSLKYVGYYFKEILHKPAGYLTAPLGISYYSLMLVSYLCDVRSRKIEPADHVCSLALYCTFFPGLIEGPISRYGQIVPALTAGEPIKAENVRSGILRIVWGLFQKLVIADHLANAVNLIFGQYYKVGGMALLGAVLCTVQLYTDFAGTIDIALGSAKLFGVSLPENFRQPFFAKNASDFWRRWHITLGTFFRDYIFYPVSLSKFAAKLTKFLRKHCGKNAARYGAPSVALLLVWLANGIWHGPKSTYLFYGLYYWVLVLIELLSEKWVKKHFDEKSKGFRTFRFIKLLILVAIGEMYFRCDSVAQGNAMLAAIFTKFDWQATKTLLGNLGMNARDWCIVLLGFSVVCTVDVLREKKVNLEERIYALPVVYRWGLLYGLMFAVILFGAYGPGFDTIAAMYAGF